MTITIRALSTIKFVGLLETNTIGYNGRPLIPIKVTKNKKAFDRNWY
jgi:hypothetical protein